MPDHNPDDKRFTPEYEVADASDIRLIVVPIVAVILIIGAVALLFV